MTWCCKLLRNPHLIWIICDYDQGFTLIHYTIWNIKPFCFIEIHGLSELCLLHSYHTCLVIIQKATWEVRDCHDEADGFICKSEPMVTAAAASAVKIEDVCPEMAVSLPTCVISASLLVLNGNTMYDAKFFSANWSFGASEVTSEIDLLSPNVWCWMTSHLI